MIKVAISQRIDEFKHRNEFRDSLDRKLIYLANSANLIPLPVPNFEDLSKLDIWLNHMSPDGILLSGGGDIGEHVERDNIELLLLAFAKEKNLPLLGICRGMQMMGHFAGTGIKKIDGHIGTRHNLIGLIKDNVNSFHNYSLAECPRDYIVTSKCDDGNIESIKHEFLPWEGWMWHPEREEKLSENQLNLIMNIYNSNSTINN